MFYFTNLHFLSISKMIPKYLSFRRPFLEFVCDDGAIFCDINELGSESKERYCESPKG